VLAGSTDMGLWVTKQLRDAGRADLHRRGGRIARIDKTPARHPHRCRASLEDAWAALASEWPALREVWLRFASPPIRRAGTMGGNVANGSPIGDAAPVLMALDAVVLRRGEQRRRLPLDDFYTGYHEEPPGAGRVPRSLEVPRAPCRARRCRPTRSASGTTATSRPCAPGLEPALQGERIADVRLAFGGMAATVQRAARAEAALQGSPGPRPRCRPRMPRWRRTSPR
jgi:xanthine dehydrogenase small subunit